MTSPLRGKARQTAASGAVKADDGALQSRITTTLKKDATLAPRNIDVDVSQGIVS